jgi:hypothetical protein
MWVKVTNAIEGLKKNFENLGENVQIVTMPKWCKQVITHSRG